MKIRFFFFSKLDRCIILIRSFPIYSTLRQQIPIESDQLQPILNATFFLIIRFNRALLTQFIFDDFLLDETFLHGRLIIQIRSILFIPRREFS